MTTGISRRRKWQIKHKRKVLVGQIAYSEGLSTRTVKELLEKGWKLSKEIGKPDIWERMPY